MEVMRIPLESRSKGWGLGETTAGEHIDVGPYMTVSAQYLETGNKFFKCTKCYFLLFIFFLHFDGKELLFYIMALKLTS